MLTGLEAWEIDYFIRKEKARWAKNDRRGLIRRIMRSKEEICKHLEEMLAMKSAGGPMGEGEAERPAVDVSMDRYKKCYRDVISVRTKSVKKMQ